MTMQLGLAMPGEEAADISSVRSKFSAAHNSLRSQGHSPVEALRIISERLISNGLDEFLGETEVSREPRMAGAVAAIALQQFMSDDVRASLGQYLTPQPVANYVSRLSVGTPVDSILDPFAGSGILLGAAAVDHPEADLLGWEVDHEVARIAQVSSDLADLNVQVTRGDAFDAWRNRRLPKVSLVVANPPFGGYVETSAAEYRQTSCARTLGGKKGAPIELLSLELCLDSLLPNGRLVIVLPQSVMTNSRYKGFRSDLFSKFTLRSWTSLPEATFAPFKGVARACVLVVDNVRPESMDYVGQYGESKCVGYDDTGRVFGSNDLGSVASSFEGAVSRRFSLTAGQATPEVVASSARGQGVKTYRLGDIASVFRGKNPARNAYVEAGPFLLKVGSLAGSFISWRDRDRSRLPRDWFNANQSKHLKSGDICFTGTAHKPRYVGLKIDMIGSLPADGAMPSGEVVVIRLDADAPMRPEVMLQYLRSAEGFAQIQSLVRGSTAHVYPNDLVEMQIPDYSEIIDIERLSALHKEAEESYRRYLDLEAQAALVFPVLSVGDNSE